MQHELETLNSTISPKLRGCKKCGPDIIQKTSKHIKLMRNFLSIIKNMNYEINIPKIMNNDIPVIFYANRFLST